MLSQLPFVSCLCPTCRRPKLLENSIACLLAQDYPADRRELIVLDDAGELQNQTGDGWQVSSIQRRFRSLPEKFDALAGFARGQVLVVWEDDDIYLPHHISSHVKAMEGHLWSKPSKVLSDYTGEIQEEDTTGCFHASLAQLPQLERKLGDGKISACIFFEGFS
ncbi:MAG: glycosyltransferase [Planctomycetota bacterium]|nr:MAG: glycosyltransferase [Planctomycetota bacterium]